MAVVGKSPAVAAFPRPRAATMRNAMTTAGSSGLIGHAAYKEAFPLTGDALTLYLWRRPAFPLTQLVAERGVPVPVITVVEALLATLVFWLFWNGHYWLGLAFAVALMPASVAAMMLARVSHAPPSARRLGLALEVLEPLLWWWAWEHGLAASGRPLDPVYATMVLWVVVGGTVAINVIEALAIHRFGMEIHAWRPLDSRFRLVSASRNPDLVILAAALLFRRPESGLVLVAWWTLISLIVHAVRLAQLTERQARRQAIHSWLDE